MSDKERIEGVRLAGRMTSSGAMVIWIALLAVLFLLVREANDDPLRASPIIATSVSATGFLPEGAGAFRAADVGVMRVLEGSVPVVSHRAYVFSFSALPVDDAAVRMSVDLFGPGYDSPKQELEITVPGGERPALVEGVIESGADVPSDVRFRIMYSGPPGLVLEGVRIAEAPLWRAWGQKAIGFALMVATLWGFCLFGAWVQRGSRDGAALRPAAILAWGFVALAAARFLAAATLPYWSGDEYVYKTIASGIWFGGREGIPHPDQILHATNLPNMLYPYVIAPAFALGDHFYLGIRLINALLVASAVFPVYAIASRFVTIRQALLLSIVSVCVPGVFISAYAVTEALFFPLFLYCVAAGLQALDRPWSRTPAIMLGLLIGALLNVRLNALVIPVAYGAAWALLTLREPVRRRPSLALQPAIVLVTMVGSYALLRWMVAGPETAGLGMYESRSGGWLSSAWSAAVADPAGVGKLVLGHMTILAYPFSIGLASLGVLLWARSGRDVSAEVWRAALFLILVVLACIGLALVFTLGVSSVDLGGLGRWHSRYYFYVFPLLLVACFMPVQSEGNGIGGRAIYWGCIAAFVIASLLFVVVYKFSADPWFGATVDSMEAHWYRFHVRWIIALAAGTVLAAYLKLHNGNAAGVIAFVLAWLCLANLGTWRELRDKSPGATDPHCGAVASRLVSVAPGPVAVVASDRRGLVDGVFWLPALPEQSRMVAANSKVSARDFPRARYIIADTGVTITDADRVPNTGSCRIYKVGNHEL